MSNVVLVGAQWGDEGKGKVVDLFAQKADVGQLLDPSCGVITQRHII